MVLEKDVIYIDTEDDITSIIGKIKDSKLRVVALVPPKRTGILQSAVNLRLLARVAENSNKKLVIVTSNKALTALSAVAMIPVAKNLQSKPELIELEELSDEESSDVIDGAKLPVGELAKIAPSNESAVDEAIEEINIDELDKPKESPKKQKKDKDSVKIPDFKSFRNKLFIGILGLLSVSIFLVWAIKFAPAARVIITTNTINAPVSITAKLGTTEATDVSKNIVQTVTKQIKKDLSIDFVATGEKDNGTKAEGTVTLSFNNMPVKKMPVEAGQKISFGDKVFIVQSDIIISTDIVGTVGYGSGKVIAEANGEAYNLGSANCSVPEYPTVGCSSTAGMAGGTTDMVSIVTAADVQKAKQTIVDMPTDATKAQLNKQFVNGEKVIGDSFLVEYAEAVPEPAIGAEVTGKAKLTSATTFSIKAIAKSELQIFLKDAVSKQMTNPKVQRVYSDGIDNVVLSGYIKGDEQATINIAATGKIGPSINENYVLKVVKGKKFGDIQSYLSQIDGIEDVEIKFSYFWVSRVPKEEAKIEIEFKSKDAK